MDNTATRAIELLQRLIATPSVSRDEARTGDLLEEYLAARGARPARLHNNVWARSEGFDPARPTLLLNSHHDTVRPAASWTRDPWTPTFEEGRLYGLGSNDAGASVVALTETFLALRDKALPFNLNADQSSTAAYKAGDMMVGSTKDVAPTESAVKINVSPFGIRGERSVIRVYPDSVALKVCLVTDVKSVFVAETDKTGIVGIVARAHHIDVMRFHYHEVADYMIKRSRVSQDRMAVVTVDALGLYLLTVYKEAFSDDLHLAQSDAEADIFVTGMYIEPVQRR